MIVSGISAVSSVATRLSIDVEAVELFTPSLRSNASTASFKSECCVACGTAVLFIKVAADGFVNVSKDVG
jgi:hypothetical protein